MKGIFLLLLGLSTLSASCTSVRSVRVIDAIDQRPISGALVGVWQFHLTRPPSRAIVPTDRWGKADITVSWQPPGANHVKFSVLHPSYYPTEILAYDGVIRILPISPAKSLSGSAVRDYYEKMGQWSLEQYPMRSRSKDAPYLDEDYYSGISKFSILGCPDGARYLPEIQQIWKIHFQKHVPSIP